MLSLANALGQLLRLEQRENLAIGFGAFRQPHATKPPLIVLVVRRERGKTP
jgi:hypothetical protein